MKALVLDPNLWFKLAVVLAALGAAATRRWRGALPRRIVVLSSLTVAYGTVMLVMASGHLAAIAYKHHLGTLPAALSPSAIPLGIAMAGVALWLVVSGLSIDSLEGSIAKQIMMGYAAMIAILVPLGPSAALAVPALFALTWQLASKPKAHAFALYGSGVAYLAMFVASFVVPGPG